MKKILNLILAIVMCLCLINLKSVNTKAIEYNEEGNEIVEAAKEEILQEEAIVDEAVENETNENVKITSGKELIAYLGSKNTSIATLVNDITIDGDGIVQDTFVYNDKTIDLNGHNITFVDTLAFQQRSSSDSPTVVTIINKSGNISNLYPANNREGYALIATRLNNNNDKTKELVLNIAGNNQNIVFDGRNQDALVGLAVGYSSLDPFHPVGYYDGNVHNVHVQSVVFEGFGSIKEEKASAAVASAFGRTELQDVQIIDCSIGVAVGNINPRIIGPKLNPSVALIDTIVMNCNKGIVNGADVGLLFFDEVVPGMIHLLRKTLVMENVIGAIYYNDTKEDYREFTIADTSSIFNNIYIDYYSQGKLAVFAMEGTVIKTDSLVKFYVDLSYWDSAIGLKGIQVTSGKVNMPKEALISMNSGLVADYDGAVVYLRFPIDGDPTPVTEELGDLYYDKDDNFVGVYYKSLPINAVAHIGNLEIEELLTVRVYDVDNIKDLKDGRDYYVEPGSVKVVFDRSYLNSLSSGKHEIMILLTTKRGNFPFRVIINVQDDKEEPEKKDESCEKVIGPTWHWNNKKGICEETDVVNTFTR